MPQDDSRETHLIQLFQLKKSNHNRIGVDATFGEFQFELKSSTRKDGISTARDLGLHTLEKYYTRYWLIAKYDAGAENIQAVYFLTPKQAKKAFRSIHKYLEQLVKTAEFIRKITKKSFFHTKHEKNIEYIIRRGVTYNDPALSWSKIIKYGTKLEPKPDYATALRKELEKENKNSL